MTGHRQAVNVADLRRSFGGQILLPADDGYDQARTAWNAMVDNRPAVIVRPTDSNAWHSLRVRVAWILAILVLAGCASDVPRDITSGLPEDWQAGAPLHPYQMSGDHGGGRGADLNPTTGLARPASCLAYRDNVSRDGDACEVREPKYSWEEDWPWVIKASWASCPTHDFGGCHNNDYPGPYESRVVAFDSAGHPVAWWDGQPAEDTQYVTE